MNLNKIQLISNSTTNTIIINNESYYLTNVEITNPSTNNVAFMVQVPIVGNINQSMVTPIYWTDNFITIFPKQSKSLNATYSIDSIAPQKPLVVVISYNDL